MSWNKDSVRLLRNRLGLTQVEFAHRLGCRQQTISEWEKGIYIPANAYSQLLDRIEIIALHDAQIAQEKQLATPREVILNASPLVAPKKVSTFSLPSVQVPEIFQEELGRPSEGSPRNFDPALD